MLSRHFNHVELPPRTQAKKQNSHIIKLGDLYAGNSQAKREPRLKFNHLIKELYHFRLDAAENSSITLIQHNCPRKSAKTQCHMDLSRSHNDLVGIQLHRLIGPAQGYKLVNLQEWMKI